MFQCSVEAIEEERGGLGRETREIVELGILFGFGGVPGINAIGGGGEASQKDEP